MTRGDWLRVASWCGLVSPMPKARYHTGMLTSGGSLAKPVDSNSGPAELCSRNPTPEQCQTYGPGYSSGERRVPVAADR